MVRCSHRKIQDVRTEMNGGIVLEMDASVWVDYVEMLRGAMCCEDGECADMWGVSSGGAVL